MTQPTRQQAAARQIERILRQSGGISTLPEVAAELLTLLAESPCDMARLAAIIQTDPALSAKLISLAVREGIAFADGRPNIQEAVALLPRESLREAILSVKVFPTLNWAVETEGRRLLPRRQLALHSLATACCAEALAHIVLPPDQRPAAYLAGLLHDIGKSAMDEVMPKSFERLLAQARDNGTELYAVEQEQLGLDHASLGKRLAEKWQLPEVVVGCIWLHHTDAQTMVAAHPQPQLCAVVALADRLARKAAIGQSGSYGEPDDIQEWVEMLRLTAEQLQQVQDELPLAVSRQCELIQWSVKDSDQAYITAVQTTAAGLARDNRLLSERSRRCEALSGQNALIDGLLEGISAYNTPLEIAEQFAAFWQQHTTCGTTAVCVIGEATDVPEAPIEMAVVARNGQATTLTLQPPPHTPIVAEAMKKAFCVASVPSESRWLLEVIGADLNPSQMQMAPLAMQDKVVGLLLFESMRPALSDVPSDVATACRMAAFAMTMALSVQKHEHLSDQFVRMLGTLRRTRTELARTQSMQGLAEMAAGAAHELNNPLAVISGRAQLLITSEQDEDKKKMLQQIQHRTDEVAQIVADLMSFAKPATPEKRSISLDELIGKAVEKTCRTHALQSLEIDVASHEAETVYVDVHQVSDALSHIFSNAIASYPGENGPIQVVCQRQDGDNAVLLKISDSGCGMDTQTLHKATQPFFSHRPAGRRRGMGLAHALRLLQLNNAALHLDSKPDQGTTVSVRLPKV